MPAPTPGYVRNMIRRSLREIVDPSPRKNDEQKIWEYFNSECAYCGKKVRKEYKEGHIDHLVSSSCGGSNRISNRVLSCASCNEKEKLDMPWEQFLKQKCLSKQTESKRKEKILRWQKTHNGFTLSKETLDKIESFAGDATSYYSEKVKQARNLRKKLK